MKTLLIGLFVLGSVQAFADRPVIEHSTCNIRSQASNLTKTDIKQLEELGFNYIESDTNAVFKVQELEGHELDEGVLLVTGSPNFYKKINGKTCLFGHQVSFKTEIHKIALRQSGDKAVSLSSQKIVSLGGVSGGSCLNKKEIEKRAKGNKLSFSFIELPICIIKN